MYAINVQYPLTWMCIQMNTIKHYKISWYIHMHGNIYRSITIHIDIQTDKWIRLLLCIHMLDNSCIH